jgi:hypothetical protein
VTKELQYTVVLPRTTALDHSIRGDAEVGQPLITAGDSSEQSELNAVTDLRNRVGTSTS